jgi:hypothetical protein
VEVDLARILLIDVHWRMRTGWWRRISSYETATLLHEYASSAVLTDCGPGYPKLMRKRQ